MKQERLKNVIETVKMHIKWEQEKIERCVDEIRDKAKNDNPRNVAMFMPGMVRELQEAIDRQKQYEEQLKMLEFLMEEEEDY